MAPEMKSRTEKSSFDFQGAAACRVSSGVSSVMRRGTPWLAVAALAVGLAACGRSPIDLAPAPRSTVVTVDAVAPSVDAVVVTPVDAAADLAPDVSDAPADLARDVAADLPRDLPTPPDLSPPPPDAPPAERPPIVEAGPVCHPAPEICNGVDDNCDGRVDEDLPPIPCPGGGNRYCVGGHFSECPRRCEACVPGGARECFTTLCTFWGTQTCASDGRTFGACREGKPPAHCAGAASGGKRTRALEDCCIAEGLCCVDEFDIDNDGDRTEMMGRCDTVLCGP
jgi:Putative metal-binding motif